MSASIHSLPETVFGEILVLCGRREGRSITLVCRQWRRLFYQQRALWRSLDLSLALPLYQQQRAVVAESYTRKLALLHRVAPLLEEACIAGSGFDAAGHSAGVDGGLAAFLQALQAATALTSLQLEQPFLLRGAADALAALSGLRQLRRSGGFGQHDAAALSTLRQLQALTVQNYTLCTFFETAPRLSPQLTSLTLHSTSTENPMPPLRALTRLSQLRELEVIEDVTYDYGGLELLPVTAFPAMQRLTLCSMAHVETSEGVVFPTRFFPNAPAVVQLRRRCLTEPPAWLLMCAHIMMSEGATLPALLDALGVQPGQLARLLFDGAGTVPQVPVAAWPQLPGVTRLIMNYTNLPLEVLLPCLPRLQVLNLTCMMAPANGRPLLAALVHSAAGLHTLQVETCDASELPQGPYLQGLRTLAFEDCRLEELPLCLAAASRLEELRLQRNENLIVSAADVDSILARLPALRLLRLDECQLAPGAAVSLQALAARQPQQLQLEITKELEEEAEDAPPDPA